MLVLLEPHAACPSDLRIGLEIGYCLSGRPPKTPYKCERLRPLTLFFIWRDSRKMKGNWNLGKGIIFLGGRAGCHEFVLRVFVLFVEETEENEGTAKRALFGGVVREFKRLEKGQVHLWLEMLNSEFCFVDYNPFQVDDNLNLHSMSII